MDLIFNLAHVRQRLRRVRPLPAHDAAGRLQLAGDDRSTRPAPRTSSGARAAGAGAATASRSRERRSSGILPARTRTRCCADYRRTARRQAADSGTPPRGRRAGPGAAQPKAAAQAKRKPPADAPPTDGDARLPAGERRMTRRRGATAIASNPVLVGVATTLVIVVAVFLAYNANAGLPWVPTYRLTAEVPSATSLVQGQRGAHRRPARRGRGQDHAGAAGRTAPSTAKLDLKLETRIRPLPVDSTIIDPATLGARPQVHRGDAAGRPSEGFPEGGHDPAVSTRRRQAGRVRRVLQHVRRAARAWASSRTCAASATPSPVAARTSTPRSRRSCRWSRNAVPVLTNIADAGDQLRPLLRLAGARREIVAPVAVHPGRAVGEPRPHARRLRRRRAPVPAGHDHEGPGGSGDRDRDVPEDPAVLRATSEVLRRAAAGRARRSTTRAPTLADGVRDGHQRRCEASPAFNRRLEHVPRRPSRLRQDPIVPIGFRDLIDTVERSTRRSAT